MVSPLLFRPPGGKGLEKLNATVRGTVAGEGLTEPNLHFRPWRKCKRVLLRFPVCALPTAGLRCTQTAATRSGRCICPRQRSLRSPFRHTAKFSCNHFYINKYCLLPWAVVRYLQHFV